MRRSMGSNELIEPVDCHTSGVLQRMRDPVGELNTPIWDPFHGLNPPPMPAPQCGARGLLEVGCGDAKNTEQSAQGHKQAAG
jgi:hypothetical protein